jgi:hypothetical protein
MLLSEREPIRHCRACGTAVTYRVPAGDNRERALCPACGTVHYENPVNVVGTVPVWDARVLLCKRAIEPRYGLWTLPAGLVELGALFTVLNVVRVGQLHLFYLATMTSPALDPGSETIEARLFSEDEMPWDQMAFRTVRETLQRYFADRRSGRFGLHCADIG